MDDVAGRNLVSKFSTGITPDLAAQVQAMGGAQAWFTAQLSPQQFSDAAADDTINWWDSNKRTPTDLYARHKSGIQAGAIVALNYERWVMARQLLTQRHVLEVMTDFWENHFNVPVMADSVFTWRSPYGQTIRQHALGRFDDLLQAADLHPAMLIYLGAATSTASHPNENLGRELLELHTVGLGNYGEDDVQNSARILTGWHVGLYTTWAGTYQTADHYVGPVQVMDFTDPNSSADGRAVTQRYLSYLAHHPATATHLATKLAVRFVSDQPSQALIDYLASVYLASDTDISAVLQALVTTPEFTAGTNSKVRNPCEEVVATYRALEVRVAKPPANAPPTHVANAMLFQAQAVGMRPHSWPQPNGNPADNASWSSPSRVLASLGVHWAMGGGYWPSIGATYLKPTDWMPASSIRLDALIDALSQRILVRRADSVLLNACYVGLGYGPGEIITATHPLVKWNFTRLISTILDSPGHLTR